MVQFKFSDKNVLGGVGKMGGKPALKSSFKLTPEEAKAFVFRYKIELGCAGTAFLTALILMQFISGQIQKVKGLDADIQSMSDREDPVSHLKKAMAEDIVLMKNIPAPLLENKFIPELTEMAKKRNVVVTGISPPESGFFGFFRRSYSQVTGYCNNFKDAILFINDIEQSAFSLKVDSWEVSLLGEPGNGNNSGGMYRGANKNLNADEPPKLNIILKVSSIEILGNEKK